MGTTTGGYPYPEGTDFVMEGDDAIRALAQTIEDKGFVAIAAGGQTVGAIDANGGSRSFTVTFPTGRFDRTPVPAQLIGSIRASFGISSITTQSMTVVGYNFTAVNAGSALTRWIALQPLPADALQVFATEPADDSTITCPTDGCGNQGIPIAVPSTWTDEEGAQHPIDEFFCGVCGTDISSTLTPAGG